MNGRWIGSAAGLGLTAACLLAAGDPGAGSGAGRGLPPAGRAPAGEGEVVLDFQALEVDDAQTHAWGLEYEEDGYRFAQPGEGEFQTFGLDEFRYPGSTALFDSNPGGVTTLTRADGGSFDVYSIDISNLNGFGPVTVEFTGYLAGGGTVESSYTTVNSENVLETHALDGFRRLTSMTWVQVSPFHQFDNVVVQDVAEDPCGDCPCFEDITGDGVVDFADILRILAAWGPCLDGAPGDLPIGLWGIDSASPATLYSIDHTTGVATAMVEVNGSASFAGLTFLGEVLHGSDLYGFPGESGSFDTGSIDRATGTVTFVSDQDFSFDWHGLAASEGAGLIYAVDTNVAGFPLKALAPDGTVSVIGQGTGIDGAGLAYDDANGVLYAINGPDDTLHRIDTATGAAELVGDLFVDTSGGRCGLAFDEESGDLYLNTGGSGRLYRVDLATGAAAVVGANDVTGIDGLAWIGLDVCGQCPCPEDVTRDFVLDVADILRVLAAWGPCIE